MREKVFRLRGGRYGSAVAELGKVLLNGRGNRQNILHDSGNGDDGDDFKGEFEHFHGSGLG